MNIKFASNEKNEDICLFDSVSIYTIIQNKQYFLNSILCKAKTNTVSSSLELISSFKNTIIILTNDINCTLRMHCHAVDQKGIYITSKIHRNGYYLETINKDKEEYIPIRWVLRLSLKHERLMLPSCNAYL